MNVSPLMPLTPLTPNSAQTLSPIQSSGGAVFGQIVDDLIKSNNSANANVERAITALATGEAQDLHTVSLAVAQADLNFRLVLEIRNRVTEALQEVLRTQI
jgi:flagellar hook-basal body complex protein FliE